MKRNHRHRPNLQSNKRNKTRNKLHCKVLDFFLYVVGIAGFITVLATYSFLQRVAQEDNNNAHRHHASQVASYLSYLG